MSIVGCQQKGNGPPHYEDDFVWIFIYNYKLLYIMADQSSIENSKDDFVLSSTWQQYSATVH